MGKDHTIYSTEYGYVRYYRNPALHPKRRYIGVALAKDGPASKLPTPHNAPTRRRLGMYATPMKETPLSPAAQAVQDSSFLEAHVAVSDVNNSLKTLPVPPQAAAQTGALRAFDPSNALRRGGHGITNYEIGRAAERKGVRVKEFDRSDRWTAWRVRAKRVKEQMLARQAKARNKTKGKKSNKKIAG